MTRRFALACALAVVVVLAVPSLAFANFAIHGNYLANTDACAGCHRAHTSVSTITWGDKFGERKTALLVTAESEMWKFCYACHDNTSQGAVTNVEEGVYEDTADTNGTFGTMLNGGAFGIYTGSDFLGNPITSSHIVDDSWVAWGGGLPGETPATADGLDSTGTVTGGGDPIFMDCATCHDPHGTSNYRLLKDSVNGNKVGGYIPTADPNAPTPDAWVQSTEVGFPDGGFEIHEMTATVLGYVPNYTEPQYAKGYDAATMVENPAKGMSGWCGGCHTSYVDTRREIAKSDGTTYSAVAQDFNANDGMGMALRHKHPVNVPLSNYIDFASMGNTMRVSSGVPLAHDKAETGAATDEATDWLECLTCHRAHGTSAIMTGYAETPLEYDSYDPNTGTFTSVTQDWVSATPSALLREFPGSLMSGEPSNRWMCEACHNK